MDLVNDTRFPAQLVRAQTLYRRLTLATVVVKASFELAANGDLVPVASGQQVPISEADVTLELGTIDGDLVPVKSGCDVAVLGHARSPQADRPVSELLVQLRIGSFVRAVQVFGDREWALRLGVSKATAPLCQRE